MLTVDPFSDFTAKLLAHTSIWAVHPISWASSQNSFYIWISFHTYVFLDLARNFSTFHSCPSLLSVDLSNFASCRLGDQNQVEGHRSFGTLSQGAWWTAQPTPLIRWNMELIGCKKRNYRWFWFCPILVALDFSKRKSQEFEIAHLQKRYLQVY